MLARVVVEQPVLVHDPDSMFVKTVRSLVHMAAWLGRAPCCALTRRPLLIPDSDFVLAYSGFVVTGSDARSLLEATAAVRRQIAFYGSTPAYRGVLDLHGWGDLHTELHRLSKINAWDTMTGLVDDTMLNTFAVVGEPKKVGAEVRRRFGDIIDRFSFYAPYQLDPQACQTMISEIHTA
jgi:hypothetical protein